MYLDSLIDSKCSSRNTRPNMYRTRIRAKPKFKKLIDYLKNYKLRSKKINDYKNWLKIHKIIIKYKKSKDMSDIEYKKIQYLKTIINSNNYRPKVKS